MFLGVWCLFCMRVFPYSHLCEKSNLSYTYACTRVWVLVADPSLSKILFNTFKSCSKFPSFTCSGVNGAKGRYPGEAYGILESAKWRNMLAFHFGSALSCVCLPAFVPQDAYCIYIHRRGVQGKVCSCVSIQMLTH